MKVNYTPRLTTTPGRMILILLLAASLRLTWLDTQSIAFDESFSLAVGSADWSVLFKAILSDGVHPPLFYIIHKIALVLTGSSEFGQRFLAAVFSIVSVALIYRAGRVIFDTRIALFSALLLALNPLQVWFAQEARMYSLLSALTIVSMLAFWQALQSNKNRYWAILVTANSIIFGLHYFGFLIPIVQFVFILITFTHNYRRLRAWVIVQAIAVLPLLPWIILTVLRESQTFGIGFLVPPTPLDLLFTYWNLALGSSYLYWPGTGLAIVIYLLTLGMALRPLSTDKIWLRQAQYLIRLWILIPPLLIWLISQRRSFYADRYLTFAIPGLILCLAFGAMRIRQELWRNLLVGGLIVASSCGLLTLHLDPAFRKDDWRDAVAYIDHLENPDDVVLLYTTHIKFVFDYYHRGGIPTKPISLNLENFPLEPLTANHQRAWVVYPYTRRPTHYPMQPLMPDGFWADDPARNPYLVEWLETKTNHIIDYQHWPGIEMWLIDLR